MAAFTQAQAEEVSIHAPARGATRVGVRIRSDVLFQSTRPRGARHERIRETQERYIVSIHAPARGATPPLEPMAFDDIGFNPRAREGRDALIMPMT